MFYLKDTFPNSLMAILFAGVFLWLDFSCASILMGVIDFSMSQCSLSWEKMFLFSFCGWAEPYPVFTIVFSLSLWSTSSKELTLLLEECFWLAFLIFCCRQRNWKNCILFWIFFSGLSLTLLNFYGVLKVFIIYNSIKNEIIFVKVCSYWQVGAWFKCCLLV